MDSVSLLDDDNLSYLDQNVLEDDNARHSHQTSPVPPQYPHVRSQALASFPDGEYARTMNITEHENRDVPNHFLESSRQWRPHVNAESMPPQPGPSVPGHYPEQNVTEDRGARPGTYPLHMSRVVPQLKTESAPTSMPIRPLGTVRRAQGRFILAVDFGTTFTGIAFASTSASHAYLQDITVVESWTKAMSNQQKVPSVISYTKLSHGKDQWGSDIHGDAVTMVNQKLELDVQGSRIDELDLTLYVLRGTKSLGFRNIRRVAPDPPAFSFHTPEAIIQSYLSKVFESTKAAIKVQNLTTTNTPIDLVVTAPVGWPYEANNALLRAVRGAGFNTTSLPTLDNTILVSEPEAAAYYAALELKNQGDDFLQVCQYDNLSSLLSADSLQKEESFVLCDAGGGTVDAVAFQVKNAKPFLELERVTNPTGSKGLPHCPALLIVASGKKCGSAYIDNAFKEWLREEIGSEHYGMLDNDNQLQRRISPHTSETGPMRELIKHFILKKKAFSSADREDIKIDLPAPLNTLAVEGRVNVFLVGGFGASPYLQEQLRESLEIFRKELRPQTANSLTAVVQGGVMYGIERFRHKDAVYVKETMDSYCIDHEQKTLEWIIKRGDVVLSGQERIIESEPFWHANNRGKQKFAIYCLKDRTRRLDDLPDSWQRSHNELEEVGTIRVGPANDLGRFDHEPRPRPPYPEASVSLNTQSRANEPRIGPMRWRFTVKDTSMKVELLVKDSSPAGRSSRPGSSGPRTTDTVIGSCTLIVELSSAPMRSSRVNQAMVQDADENSLNDSFVESVSNTSPGSVSPGSTRPAVKEKPDILRARGPSV
ncbi:hypothetical protein LTR62_006711 [Meristemomyces frigidus]|uniref:Actin-like ATPase domain-containing protein n=1 Tax=Meristemomyces frigidus TaxID=1508187 RepID=A0AAN7YRX3_9PEZI|nr:hypothetical protein LTR62_006711 [Meristemomyces frigidus]